jgi:pyruvyltransferase
MKITLRYFQKWPNWGDALNPYLLRSLFPNATIVEKTQVNGADEDHLLAIGSVIHWASARSIIWGTGAILPSVIIAAKPKAMLAVRGPLTRQVLELQGLHCPSVYGDPALLLPRFFVPTETSGGNRQVGIVAHYVDKDSVILKHLEHKGAKLIDVFAGIEQYVREICSCKCVLSSSLHGLICADAYGIPSRWIRLSDKIIGDGFKFRDYYLSRGSSIAALELTGEETLDELTEQCRILGDSPDLDALTAALMDHFHRGSEATRV